MDEHYKSDVNRDVAPAADGEFAPIDFGSFSVWPPVVLAPMAGITNYPFRTVCRQYGAGLYVSEMITARALVEGNAKTLKLAGFNPDESPRSLQLYGVDPEWMGRAVAWLCGEGLVDHIDMNFGCPVRKVTRKGGGAALPAKPLLLAKIVRAAVKAAGDIPVSMKFRIGIDDDWLTFRDAGRIGEEEGCVAIAMHARTAAQHYDGHADWNAIGELKQHVTTIPVLGNGDIWEAGDALRMMRMTGCDGVVVGRGCLGRPWLFRDLAEIFAGNEPPNPPNFGEIAEVMLEHARLLVSWMGERLGIRNFRKHATWYTKGFPDSAKLRGRLIAIDTFEQLEGILAEVDPKLYFPVVAMRVPRGKSGGRQKVALPEGYRDQVGDDTAPGADAEVMTSGG